MEDIYNYSPQSAAILTHQYFNSKYRQKSELAKEMELIKIYNDYNFEGFPDYSENYLDEIEPIPDAKLQHIYLRRLLSDDIGKIERRLLGAYGTEAINANNEMLKF